RSIDDQPRRQWAKFARRLREMSVARFSCVWIRRACYESNGPKGRSCIRRVRR
ncbi:unnamed protein product, partial [Ascophyllum nodosum]